MEASSPVSCAGISENPLKSIVHYGSPGQFLNKTNICCDQRIRSGVLMHHEDRSKPLVLPLRAWCFYERLFQPFGAEDSFVLCKHDRDRDKFIQWSFYGNVGSRRITHRKRKDVQLFYNRMVILFLCLDFVGVILYFWPLPTYLHCSESEEFSFLIFFFSSKLVQQIQLRVNISILNIIEIFEFLSNNIIYRS